MEVSEADRDHYTQGVDERMSTCVSFKAILQKATTLVDGGWRVSFDVAEDDTQAILILSQMRDTDLHVGVVPEDMLDEENESTD